MNRCELTECGMTPNGLRVRAITDVMGAQVVVTNDLRPDDDSLLSESFENHAIATIEGKRIAKDGVEVYDDWRGPISTLMEWAETITRGQR